MRCFFKRAGEAVEMSADAMECESIDGARIEAARLIAEIIKDDPKAVWTGANVRVDVSDEHHALLFSIMVVAADSPAIDHTALH